MKRTKLRGLRHSSRSLLVLLAFSSGCATVSVPPAGAPSSALVCQEPAGLDALIRAGAGLLLGEIHGTAESPAFTGEAACVALARGLAVTVALEIPREEGARIEAFLASRGGPEDRAALVAGPFWQDEYQDGRRSVAMAELLERLRVMKRGRTLTVALIDRVEQPTAPAERDRWMAEALAQAFAENPRGFVISLTGNIHSRIERGTPWNPDFETAGFVLKRDRPELDLTALDAAHTGGSAWICLSAKAAECGAQTLGGHGAHEGGKVVLFAQLQGGYSGVYEVGAITASPPAKSALKSP